MFSSPASKAGPCTLPSHILVWWEGRGQREGEEGEEEGGRGEGEREGWGSGRGGNEGGCPAAFPTRPRNPFSGTRDSPGPSPGNQPCLPSSGRSLCSCYSNHQGSVYRRRLSAPAPCGAQLKTIDRDTREGSTLKTLPGAEASLRAEDIPRRCRVSSLPLELF